MPWLSLSKERVREAELHDGSAADAATLVIDYVLTEIIYVPEIVNEIPNQELVEGWEMTLDIKPFFVDRNSELSFATNIVGGGYLPTGLTIEEGILKGAYVCTGSFNVAFTASSEGQPTTDTFVIYYIASTDDLH